MSGARPRAGTRKAAPPARRVPWTAFLLLVLANLASALGVVWSSHQNRNLLNELQGLENARNAMVEERGQLLLEQSSLVSQGRIEDKALRELGMQVPATDNIVVINGG